MVLDVRGMQCWAGNTGSAAEELLDLRVVGLGDLRGAAHPAGDLGRLVLQVVAEAGLLTADLARSGDPEPLAGARVGLVLRHEWSVLVVSLVLGADWVLGVAGSCWVLGA